MTGAGGECPRGAGFYSSLDLRGRAVVGDPSGKAADLVELLQWVEQLVVGGDLFGRAERSRFVPSCPCLTILAVCLATRSESLSCSLVIKDLQRTKRLFLC